MKTKRSMLLILAVAVALFSVPSLATGAPVLPAKPSVEAPVELPAGSDISDVSDGSDAFLGALEQLDFSPLLYLSLVFCLVVACLLVIIAVFASKYRHQKLLICQNYQCLQNPFAHDVGYAPFDYRDMETPEELTNGYTSQSELVVLEAIRRTLAQTELTAAPSVSEGVVPQVSGGVAAPQVSGGVTPWTSGEVALQAAAQVSGGAAPSVSGGVAASSVSGDATETAYQPRHNKKAGMNTEPLPIISLVPPMKHARVHRRSQVAEVPFELEELLRKIS